MASGGANPTLTASQLPLACGQPHWLPPRSTKEKFCPRKLSPSRSKAAAHSTWRSPSDTELPKAYKDREWYLCVLKTEPTLDSLRPDPRFQDLLRRLNFTQD